MKIKIVFWWLWFEWERVFVPSFLPMTPSSDSTSLTTPFHGFSPLIAPFLDSFSWFFPLKGIKRLMNKPPFGLMVVLSNDHSWSFDCNKHHTLSLFHSRRCYSERISLDVLMSLSTKIFWFIDMFKEFFLFDLCYYNRILRSRRWRD